MIFWVANSLEVTCHFPYCSAAGALASAVECASSEEDDASQESMKHELPLISSADGAESKKLMSSTFQSHSEIEVEKRNVKTTLSPSTNLDIRLQEQNTVEDKGSQILKVDDPKKAFTMGLSEQGNTEHRSISETELGKGFLGKVVDGVSSQSVSNYPPFGSNVEPLPKMLPSTSPNTWHSSGSNASVDGSKIPGKVDNSDKSALQSATSLLKSSTGLKEKPSMTFTSFGQSFMSAPGNNNSLPAYPNLQVPSGSTSALGKGFRPESKTEGNAAPSPLSQMQSSFASVKAFQSEPKNAPTSPPLSMQSNFASGKVLQSDSRKELNEPPSPPLLMQSIFPSKKVFQSESKKDLNAHPPPMLQMPFVQNVSKQFGNVRGFTC